MIDVTDLSFEYDDGPRVFEDLSLTIPEGETVAVLGANGTGKTTFLRLLAGLLTPTNGEIRIDGDQDPTVGLTPEIPADGLFAATVSEEVAFFPENRGLAVETQVTQALEALGITHLADRIPQALSEGEKRLVTIASVLSGDPDVIGLDEPTSGLDESGWRRLGERLAALDRTVVLVTHDTDFAWRYADSAVVLTDSGVDREGPIREILADSTYDLAGVGLTTPEPVVWARERGIEEPPRTVAAAVELIEGEEP
ncbi:energy-coupling factor ABC transporter ATP-binding protein [Halodesulfurarchaeum formicicum]|uniref:Cobalt/nickel transport system ATP-binding protein n=1 Tax=Halodesulfurarchaeum formicicum TaxID=1873524 RepID=A0A1J1AEZ5_9EURY|nr:ABC transporter ATP-binding protein [Halodesulfurarchaeum formicicum]APE96279.1 cobalt/nickel transport system ATP-binding protein [Halodesulfurarchaeum formicicum]